MNSQIPNRIWPEKQIKYFFIETIKLDINQDKNSLAQVYDNGAPCENLTHAWSKQLSLNSKRPLRIFNILG